MPIVTAHMMADSFNHAQAIIDCAVTGAPGDIKIECNVEHLVHALHEIAAGATVVQNVEAGNIRTITIDRKDMVKTKRDDLEDMLERCVKLAAEQTRPPQEIVVVDSSPDWNETRDWILRELAPNYPNIAWQYAEAIQRSTPSQRNQAIRMASADVVFLIDDDSLMYPDCAEKIMEVYEADFGGAISGVNAIHVNTPPDRPEEVPDAEYGTSRNYGAVAAFVRQLLRANDHFVPYDAEWPRLPIPEAVAKLNVDRWGLAAGWGMTFRREICLKEPFEEILLSYAAGEDSDMSYRASRHGAYVGRNEARLCHVGSRGGRLDILTVSTLKGLNILVMHRLNTTDVERGRRSHHRLMARRALIALAKDLKAGRLQIPEARGWFRAVRMVNDIFDREPEQIRAWYPEFQKQVLGR